jgi:hypothetical protein
MIERDAVMPLLLEACPSFGPAWQDYAQNPLYRPDLLYIHLGEFAAHLVGLMKRNQLAEFPAVFAVVERLHVEGDSYVREAATIGLLEGLQNIPGSDFDPKVFAPFLDRDSRMFWDRLNEFWDGKLGVK